MIESSWSELICRHSLSIFIGNRKSIRFFIYIYAHIREKISMIMIVIICYNILLLLYNLHPHTCTQKADCVLHFRSKTRNLCIACSVVFCDYSSSFVSHLSRIFMSTYYCTQSCEYEVSIFTWDHLYKVYICILCMYNIKIIIISISHNDDDDDNNNHAWCNDVLAV